MYCELYDQGLLVLNTPFVVMDDTWVLSVCVPRMRNPQLRPDLHVCSCQVSVFMTMLRTVCFAHVNKMQL